MGLAKILVDGLNEKAIQKQFPDKIENEKGISKLERWLRKEKCPSTDDAIAFLRRLQRLRSKLTAHRKGSDHMEFLADEGVDADPIKEVASMLQEAEGHLNGLALHFGIDLDSV